MPDLRGHQVPGLIPLVHELPDLLLQIQIGLAGGVEHAGIVQIPEEVEVVLGDLGIIRLVDLQDLQEDPGLVVEDPHVVEVGVPVPRLAGLLLDESDGPADLLGGVFLSQRVHHPFRGGDGEGGFLKSPVLQAVAHEGGVAGGIAVQHAAADIHDVVLDAHAQFRLRHGAHVAGDAELLGAVDVADGGFLGHRGQGEDAEDLGAHAVEVGESPHDLFHHVLLQHHHLPAELFTAADVPVAPEHQFHGFGDLLDDEVELHVRDAQLTAPEALGAAVDEVLRSHVLQHPAVPEKALDALGMGQELEHGAPVLYPAAVVVPGVGQAPPFPAGLRVSSVIKGAQGFAVHFLSHYRSPPWIFLISMLSTNACTRVRI